MLETNVGITCSITSPTIIIMHQKGPVILGKTKHQGHHIITLLYLTRFIEALKIPGPFTEVTAQYKFL